MKILYVSFFIVLSGKIFSQAAFNNTGNFYAHTNANIAFYGDFSNSGTYTDIGLSTRFMGVDSQTVSGLSATTFKDLHIDNSVGVSLAQNVTVSNVLHLPEGPLYLNSSLLTISSGDTSAVLRTNGYVVSEQTDNSGRMLWNIGSAIGPHKFPLGTIAGTYIPFTLNLTAGNIGNVTLSTYPTAADNTPYPSAPNAVPTMIDSSGADNSTNTVDRFWQINKDGPSGTATLTFTATPAEIGSIWQLKARRWNTTTQEWEDPLPNQTNTATSATVPNVTSFSPWTVAGTIDPLAIELVNFAAKVNEHRTVDLNWTTSSEINNDFFTVERSKDLVHFEMVQETRWCRKQQ